MNYYTSTIPPTLAEKLKEKGMPIKEQPLYAKVAPNARGIVEVGTGLRCPSYAEVFDWLMEKGVFIKPDITDKDDGTLGYVAEVILIWESTSFLGVYSTWHEAANAAIEKALTLI